MEDVDREAVKTAMLHALGDRVAALGALVVGVAVEFYMDEVKTALGKVYDLSAVEEKVNRMMQAIEQQDERWRDREQKARYADKRLDELLDRVENGHIAVSELARRFNHQKARK